nr:M28 family peptidase [Planctomycetota bacterium]
MDENRFRKRASFWLLAIASFFALEDSSALAGKLSLKAALKSISIPELKNHITFLASDALEGREGGTTGAWAASKYIISELKKIEGLEKGDGGPGDDTKDWLQYFNGNFRNILVSLPGSDPDLKDEVILIGAHYDHVGYGSRSNSRGPIGFVHNGADDNA